MSLFHIKRWGNLDCKKFTHDLPLLGSEQLYTARNVKTIQLLWVLYSQTKTSIVISWRCQLRNTFTYKGQMTKPTTSFFFSTPIAIEFSKLFQFFVEQRNAEVHILRYRTQMSPGSLLSHSRDFSESWLRLVQCYWQSNQLGLGEKGQTTAGFLRCEFSNTDAVDFSVLHLFLWWSASSPLKDYRSSNTWARCPLVHGIVTCIG